MRWPTGLSKTLSHAPAPQIVRKLIPGCPEALSLMHPCQYHNQLLQCNPQILPSGLQHDTTQL